MKVTTQIEEAKTLHAESIEKMDEQDAKIQSLPDDTPEEERKFHSALFDKYQSDAERRAETLERLVAISKARQDVPPLEDEGGNGKKPAGFVQVGSEDRTYSPKSAWLGVSFWRDLVYSSLHGEAGANDRLRKHMEEERVEQRDLSTTATAGGNFVPPAYLGNLFAELPRPKRPLADAIGSRPLQATGMSITIPRITTGTAVAVQAGDNAAVNETNLVEALLTVPVNTIAGQQDLSVQLLDRSDPSMEQIVFEDLRRAYDSYLDTQLISGLGSSNQHLGIRAVSTINAVTYTDATPTAAELHPKVYDAIQRIASNRLGAEADMVILHPRRAAWLASNLSSTFPLYQQGSFMQAAGAQDQGMLQSFAGMRVVRDANIGTTYGAATDEDEIYVVASSDLILMEGPLQARVLPDVGSGTLTVRLQLFAYSAFVSGRQPKSISKIAGTGLVVPVF